MPTLNAAPHAARRIKIEAEGDFEDYEMAKAEAVARAKGYTGH
jgi:hypothetical protein